MNAQHIWNALKELCCSDPDKAKRIVMLEEGVFVSTVNRFLTAHQEHILALEMMGDPKNWTQDAGHENGCYQNHCVECETMFLGHKRRMICRSCHRG